MRAEPEPPAGLVSALEARAGNPFAPFAARARLARILLGLGVRADVAALLSEPPKDGEGRLAWLDLALEAEAATAGRADLLADAARRGWVAPRDLAARLDVVAEAAAHGMSAWVTRLAHAFPPERRTAASAVLTAAFGVVPEADAA